MKQGRMCEREALADRGCLQVRINCYGLVELKIHLSCGRLHKALPFLRGAKIGECKQESTMHL